MSSRNIVSLFSGAGGLSRGFADAGIPPSLAAEIDENAVATYRRNISQAAIQIDIGAGASEVIAAAQCRGLDHTLAVIGGPPCQGFSTAGSRLSTDPRNRLVFSYLEIVARLRPSWFLFENVEGILTSGDGDAVVSLAEQLTELGYSFRIEKINFAYWGVPQARKRVLIVGNRHGINFTLPSPTHAFDGKKHRSRNGLSSVLLGDALSGLPEMVSNSLQELVPYSPATDNAYSVAMRNGGTEADAHVTSNFTKEFERIKLLKAGQSLRDLPEEMWPDSFRSRAFRRVADGIPTERRGGAPSGLRRLDPTHASLTVTSLSSRELIHPIYDRPLSLRECARLQSFPDTYRFTGNFQAVATQIGNAFPPLAAKTLAAWMLDADGGAGGDVAGYGKKIAPGLIGYNLTEAVAMSPALKKTDLRLKHLMTPDKLVTLPQNKSRPIKSNQFSLFDTSEDDMLGPEDRKTVTDGRTLGPVSMTDREMARLISVALRDLGHEDIIPEWAKNIPYKEYYEIPLDWFTQDQQRPFEFDKFYLTCKDAVENFRVIFRCLTKLHRHRRKYEIILRTQPLPTMEQVARRGLLEYGSIPVDALASWLTWRKWIYDIDNRSAQETGYLFEPMLSESLGGKSVSAKASPVKRADDPTKGRQVDCIVEVDGRKLAYEFKDRITIAASGQGRFSEELAFPKDCKASGYTPILMVMDPTPNDKLTAISNAFVANDGEVYLGDAVWTHLSSLSGKEIANFVKKYIKDPVEEIAVRERELLDIGLRYRTGSSGDSVEISIGNNTWIVPRPRRDEAVEVDSDEEEAL